MVSRIYKTNLYTAYKYNCEQDIDPPCLVKCSGQGGGFVSCSPKYIIKKSHTVPKTMGWRWFKAIWNGFFSSRERKEEYPRNYYSLRARERKNTFYITLNQRQHLTFGTVQ